ncbi:MAG: tRNA threonylcarbamoyladenosine biosynthesis protein TsaE [Bacteriovoracaceae bacterium]|jgi:tRNA threonylcarbamoyladenosine biosynthesis protein TsaE
MIQKEIRSWKKVFESDLTYIAYELKEIVQEPALIILEGPLGGGKTTFSKVFIDGDETFSPSYSVLSDTINVLHGDFYRIKDREEIIHLELPLYLEDKKYFLVEWGKKHFSSITKELPEDFAYYLLEVSINEMTGKDGPQSRNFVLFEVKED